MAPKRPAARWLFAAAAGCAAAYLAAFAAIWVPEWQHWHVRPQPPSAAELQALRSSPPDAVLHEIGGMSLRGAVVAPDALITTADRLLQGRLSLPTFAEQPVGLPFDPADLDRGSAMWQLMMAGLAPADVLLDAYRANGKELFFERARQTVIAFERYESGRWLDRGLMWNDHGVAARVPVLVKLWLALRQRGQPDAEAERAVLNLAARSALFLAKPDTYAWRNSHGILSNLALLQLAAAFPALPEAAAARDVAAARMRLHLDYWINREGVTLLHSAGYHVGSMNHFSLALRLYTLNGLPIPADWWHRYEQAVEFMALLRRPDGTLPMFGDTMNYPVPSQQVLTARSEDGGAQALAMRTVQPHGNAGEYPAAGHLVWWQPDGSAQTTATWANHDGLGHKLADDLSVQLWSHGNEWVTNVGYWPYDDPARSQAEGWAGSNAPHAAGEPTASVRSSRMLASGVGAGVRFADLERTGPGSTGFRRQLLHLAAANAWLVVDSPQHATSRWQTWWTFNHQLAITERDTTAWTLERPGQQGSRLHVQSQSGGRPQPARELRGSTQPWGGWQMDGRTPVPATTLALERSPDTPWALTLFRVQANDAAAKPAPATVKRWVGPDDWEFEIGSATGRLSVRRSEALLIVQLPNNNNDARTQTLNLKAPPPIATETGRVRAAFAEAAGTFRRFPEVVAYRYRASWALLGALVLQEVAFAGLWLSRWRRALPRLRAVTALAWLCMAWWLASVYFRTQ